MNNKNPKKWITLITIFWEMLVVILAGVFLGKWLDSKYSNPGTYTFTIIFSLTAIFIALYLVIKKVNNLNEK